MGALRRGPGQVVEEEEEEEEEGRRGGGSQTRDLVLFTGGQYLGPSLTPEGRLTLTQPHHLLLLLGLHFSLDPSGALHN